MSVEKNSLPNLSPVGTRANEKAAMMALYQGTKIDFRQYRSFETLPREAWQNIDNILIRTAKENLVGIADLNANPSTNMMFDGMSASVYTRKRISEVGSATVAVTPDTAAASSILAMDDLSVPMVVTYKDFNMNTAHAAMAASIGMPLSYALVEEATRSVARKLEETLFVGNIPANGSHVYGYFTFPSAQYHQLSGGVSWTTADPDQIMKDVNTMMSKSMEHHHFGPWMLYIPWEYQARLNEDYVIGAGTESYKSIRTRLLELNGLINIRVSHYVPTDKVALVEMTSDTVVLINAMPMRALAWEPPGTPNWDHKFKVMAMAIPLLIADYKNQCGIVTGGLDPE